MLVLGLERGADHAGRRVVDEDVERPEPRDLLEHAVGGDVAAHEHRLGAERSQLRRRLLGGRVRAHVADRDPGGAVAGEAERDRLADPARAARDEDGPAHQPARGRGRETGADDGISSQPIRVRGSSGSSSSAFDEAWPRSSSRRIFSSPKRRTGSSCGQVGDQLAHARPDLEREVGRGGPDEGLDVVEGRLCHRGASLTI